MKYELFKEKLKEAELTLKDFGEFTGISYSTCNNWKYTEAPSWTESWLQLYIENKNMRDMKKLAVKMSELNETALDRVIV